MTFTVMIVEDEPDVAEVIAYAVRLVWPDAGVTIAGNGTQAVRRFGIEPAQLVILDLVLPGHDGFEVCRRMRERSRAPILMLTARDATLDKVRALDLGADDYLTKPFDHLELMARLRALRRRADGAPADESLRIGLVTLDRATRRVRRDDEAIRLTATEFDLLELFMRHAGTVLPREFLLSQVWGTGYGSDPRVLKVFVERLRRKLGDDAAHPIYIETVRGIGYRYVPEF